MPNFKSPAGAAARPASRMLLLVLLAVLAVGWFGTLNYRHLVKPDEGRYAEVPREMAASDDWVTPRLNGLKYFEKPALQYWATAAAYKAFGEHEWTARLWAALTGFAGILLAFVTGRRLFGLEAGLNAALVLASMTLYSAMGHVNTLDMGVTFFMQLTLCGFLLGQQGQGRARFAWMMAAYAGMALAILSKGLIGVVLPGAVLVLYMLVQRDWRLPLRLHLLPGLALLLLISAPWFVLVCRANPEFFHFFFIHEHFERFLTKEHHRYQPWYYFVPILLGGLLPWVLPVFDAAVRAWRRPQPHPTLHPERLLLIWAAFIYFFFSISDSKLPSYILPIFPALALLAGQRLAEMSRRALFWQILPVFALTACIFLLHGLIKGDPSSLKYVLLQHYWTWITLGAKVMVITFAAALLCRDWFPTTRNSLLLVAFGGFLGMQIILLGHETMAPTQSSNLIAAQIRPYDRPGAPFYSVDTYDQTLPFYLKRTFTLVSFEDELAFGISQEPGKFIADHATFERVWRQQPYALAIMPPETFAALQRDRLPMRVIARDDTRVVVATPAAMPAASTSDIMTGNPKR